MEGNEKKPPIDIRKKAREEEIHGPGSLDYAGEHERRPKKPSTGVNWMQVMLSVVIASALSALMLFQFGATQQDVVTLSENSDELLSRISAVQSDLGKETTRINNIVNTQGDYAKKTELAGYAKATDAITVAKVKEIYESRVATLEAQVKALKDQVAVLEAGPSAEDGDDVVTCELKSWGEVAVSTGSTSLDAPYKAIITNTSSSDLEDVVFTFLVQPSPVLPSLTTATLTGGYTVWSTYASSPFVMVFQNGWGFDLEAGETKKIMLTLHLEFGTTLSPTMFDTEMEVEDYDVK